MGRQIAVAMTYSDEMSFLSFLRKTANIQIFESSAPTKQMLFVETFSADRIGHSHYYIWNKSFRWDIEFGRVTHDKTGIHQGWYYIRESTAPIIEYHRHDFESKMSRGRIYWSKYFSAPNGVDYDVDLFEKWYNSVVRWIRKNGVQKDKGAFNTYYLPDAWANMTAMY